MIPAVARLIRLTRLVTVHACSRAIFCHRRSTRATLKKIHQIADLWTTQIAQSTLACTRACRASSTMARLAAPGTRCQEHHGTAFARLAPNGVIMTGIGANNLGATWHRIAQMELRHQCSRALMSHSTAMTRVSAHQIVTPTLLGRRFHNLLRLVRSTPQIMTGLQLSSVQQAG